MAFRIGKTHLSSSIQLIVGTVPVCEILLISTALAFPVYGPVKHDSNGFRRFAPRSATFAMFRVANPFLSGQSVNGQTAFSKRAGDASEPILQDEGLCRVLYPDALDALTDFTSY